VPFGAYQRAALQLAGRPDDPGNSKNKYRRALKARGTLVRYHSGGSMKLNACILLLSHMVYL
jgi:hypothetical protein